MSQAFDGITYSKGEAVIRMLEATLGEAAGAPGRAYMRQHAYGNATSHDLWQALEVAAKQPVRRMARGLHRATGGATDHPQSQPAAMAARRLT